MLVKMYSVRNEAFNKYSIVFWKAAEKLLSRVSSLILNFGPFLSTFLIEVH